MLIISWQYNTSGCGKLPGKVWQQEHLLTILAAMQAEKGKKFIDIERVIANKNPRLLRFMPGFLLKYIKRILHQNEINDFIERQGHKRSHEFVDAIVTEFGVKIDFQGLENVPEKGGCILASNHPLGGLDAMALIKVVGEKRKDIKFIVNDVLLQLENLEELFAGVNKHGKNTAEMLSLIDDLYGSGIAMLIFPAGLVSRKQGKGLIKDLEWKKSFIAKARKHRLPVIPVYIKGNNTNFFYNFAKFRTRVGIKQNIEMFYLVDEMYKQKGHHIEITFGKPIQHTVFTGELNDKDWAQKVKDHVYILKDSPIAEFNPRS